MNTCGSDKHKFTKWELWKLAGHCFWARECVLCEFKERRDL